MLDIRLPDWPDGRRLCPATPRGVESGRGVVRDRPSLPPDGRRRTQHGGILAHQVVSNSGRDVWDSALNVPPDHMVKLVGPTAPMRMLAESPRVKI
jgi:hypothetical protein